MDLKVKGKLSGLDDEAIQELFDKLLVLVDAEKLEALLAYLHSATRKRKLVKVVNPME